MKSLHPDDAEAIDMALSQRGKPVDVEMSMASRLQDAMHTLAQLAHMPDIDPPTDLIKRTLARVQTSIAMTTSHAPMLRTAARPTN